ncbi:MAG: efflux RND transporter periplasmic adaptor subunit [Flavobacteriales bacterium]|nr:efflux RND transporter periplasmic adaptor subunit [Flavobacteriales bacterium]
MNRKLILPLVLIVLALGVGLKLAANKKKLNAAKQPIDRSAIAIPVTVFTANPNAMAATFSVPGTLEPQDHAKVMVNAQGDWPSLNVGLGSRVVKGQVLGSLDVALKQLELAAAELQMGKLKKDNDRYKDLYEGKAATEANYDDARFNYESQRVKVDQIRQQIRDAQVVAPVSGVVVAKNVEVGEYVSANTAVVEVVGLVQLKAKVSVSEHDAYRLREGSPVRIATDVFPGDLQGGRHFREPARRRQPQLRSGGLGGEHHAHPLKSGTLSTPPSRGDAEGNALLIPKTALGEGMKTPMCMW